MDITKEDFEKMYFSMTNKEMAKKLKISHITLIRYAKKLGFKKRESFSTHPKLNIIN